MDKAPNQQWLYLRVVAANIWKSEMDRFEITLPDGRKIVLDHEGTIEVLEEIGPTRAEKWRLLLN